MYFLRSCFLRSTIVGVDRQEQTPRLNRSLIVLETVAVDHAELGEQLDLGLLVVSDFDLLLQDHDELIVLARVLVERSKGAEGCLVARIGVQHFRPQADADIGLAQALGGKLSDFDILGYTSVRYRDLLLRFDGA